MKRLLSEGIGAVDRRGGAVDHITARRMSLLLISQSHAQQFTRGLIRFTRDGAITDGLKRRLHDYAGSPGHLHQPPAARILQYAAARGTDLGPIGTDFAAACDQIDRTDITLADLRISSANPGTAHKPHQPEPGRRQLTAIDHHDPACRSAGLVPEDTTANAAIHAIAVSAADRDARTDAEPPDPEWPGFAPCGRRPSHAFTLATSPWYTERYPDKAANLWDALHVGRASQPAPEPDRLADWEAGE